ncbi:hypothetical protein BGW39_001860 [Mortierella sp. 14UC]|nr:hypothetical protein BGW39_001860 [Mortierella sp. 14UC]
MHTVGLDPSKQTSIDAFLQDTEEQNTIYGLTIRVDEAFVADNLKDSGGIAEVVLLGPFLDQEYYRKPLNCFVAEFEAAKLLDVDLLQGLVYLVQCAGPDYLQPDDLVRILVVLRIRLQDTHQQTTKHPYYLTLALSGLLDVMVDGKVQDLKRVVDHEPLSALLVQLKESSDPYLKHQATYALQGVLHIPNDETRRQFVLRHAGNIAMGLLGIASVCSLDLSGLAEGAGKLREATVSAFEICGKAVEGVQAIYESGQGIAASVKGGILSGGRLLWYTALREAREHIQNGRLSDFNYLVFEAPCKRDIEFQRGVCQLLGEIAVDSQWELVTRQQATDFLAELCRNDANEESSKEIDRWILAIFRQVITSADAAISHYAQSRFQGLEKTGNAAKQALYRVVLDGPHNPYPIWAQSPAPLSFQLLIRVQAIPDVENDLHRLRSQRLKERENTLYILPQAKPTLQSSDNTLFPLMEKTLEFLNGSGQVLLLLGDSGGGKSTFNLELEYTLWHNYKRGGLILLYINLPTIDNPQQKMIAKKLLQLNFSDAQIQQLQQHRQFIVICDGYDESQLKKNIYATNFLNQPGQWKAKMFISCPSQYLGADYRARFQPTGDRSSNYMDKLNKIPKMIELVANPFLLTLALRALPKIANSAQDLSAIHLTRVGLYDSVIEEWLQTDKLRLEGSTLSTEAQAVLEELLDANFIQLGINFQKDLATAIFQHQGGNPVVQYVHHYDSKTWKAVFFSPDIKIAMLRESSPLTRSGDQYRFLHRSILEYLYSRVMSDPLDPSQATVHSRSAPGDSVTSFVNHPLNQRSIVDEPSILQFLAERAGFDPLFKARLHAAVEKSKVDARVSQAAANAISILVRAGTLFNGVDLRGVRIPELTFVVDSLIRQTCRGSI